MSDIGVFIRGIYSTALTKIFLDFNYQIIFPSKDIQKRFNLPFQNDLLSKDITIKDRNDKQGISLKIKKQLYNELAENEFKTFPLTIDKEPFIVRTNSNFNVNDIYRGEVIKSSEQKNYSLIKLASRGKYHKSKFSTNVGYIDSFLDVGTKKIFQVRKEDYGSYAAELEKGYTLPGDLLVLLPDANKVFISKKINDPKERKRLTEIGNELLDEKNFGIICRTVAKFANNKEIERDFNNLENTHRQILELISKMPDFIGKIFSQSKSINFLFSFPFKKKLDEIRKEVINTISHHHTIKSLSGRKDTIKPYNINGTDLLDYTEDMIEDIRKSERKRIEAFYLEKYFERIQNGKWMNIDHRKLTGENIHLRGGRIESFIKKTDSPLEVKLRREFKSGGTYDGLDLPIETGDYALSIYREGQWYYINEYYSDEGKLKGKYININTPLEISNRIINYIDLEVDIVENERGERKIIDLDDFEQLFESEFISKRLYEIIKTLLSQLQTNNHSS
ncbi:MAG: DUF402 domain-containing protein [Candidatus Lokiarchaeota archaeon]|nr:DUF402 domain-containing protein [Candidatus Lokiarchaeota archaeon]